MAVAAEHTPQLVQEAAAAAAVVATAIATVADTGPAAAAATPGTLTSRLDGHDVLHGRFALVVMLVFVLVLFPGRVRPGERRPHRPRAATGSQQQQQENNEQKGDNTGQTNLPGRRNGALNPALDAARAAWGNLPDRVREMLVQGTNDRFSDIYKKQTEEYYRKLAEQGKQR